MLGYPYPCYSYRTPLDLDLYPSIKKRQLKSVDGEFQAKVGYWVSINHLQDYKIYGIMIKMFIPQFLSSLPQPTWNNPWLTHPANINFKTRFHWQCDYLLKSMHPKEKWFNLFFLNGQETIQMQRMIHVKHQFLHITRKWTSWWRPIQLLMK
jgi:hypothetical protein